MTHKKYNKVHRLGKDEVKGILDYPVTVQEKIDGCFNGGTRIMLADGSETTISKIVNQDLDVEVMTYNFDTGRIEPSKILNKFNHGNQKTFIGIITDSGKGSRNNKTYVTSDHLYYTNKGWKESKDLVYGDIIYTVGSGVSRYHKQLILGSLLGDSSVYGSKNKGICYSHGLKQEEYSDYKNSILQDYFKHKEYRISGYGFKGTRNRSVCCKELNSIIEKTLVGGKKIINEEWLSNIDELGLAFWYMDDGSLSHTEKQEDRANFHTEGFSEEEQDLLINMLKNKFNINAVKQYYKGYCRLRVNKNSADILFSIIAEYVPLCMRYKIPLKYKDYPLSGHNILVPKYSLTELKFRGFCEVPKWLSKTNYDIETNNSNYFANGILVHNSNASIWVEDGEIKVGSRNHEVPEFNGLKEYALGHKGILALLEQFPTCRLFGEWLIKHTINYNQEAYKHFYLFDIYDHELEQWLSQGQVYAKAMMYAIKTPEVLISNKIVSEDEIMKFVGKSSIGEHGEGVVIKAEGYVSPFGDYPCYAKIMTPEFLEKNALTFGNGSKEAQNCVEVKLIHDYITPARVKKVVQKIESQEGRPLSVEDCSRVSNTVYHDFIEEETWSAMAKKNKRVCFKTLGNLSKKKAVMIFKGMLNGEDMSAVFTKDL